MEIRQEGHRFIAKVDGVDAGLIECDPVGEESLLIRHTEVQPSHEGRGIGAALVRHAIEAARRDHRSVIPACAYAAEYIRRHPEYLQSVRESDRDALR